MTATVRTDEADGVAVVTLDGPPVNAFSLDLRAAVADALERGLADEGVVSFVIAGAGRIFSAGADIREFDGDASTASPNLPELITLIEDSPKPVVAALHGTALGGACELALACHDRIAATGTKIGLPEVTLGIVPGAGGTQRMPRVVGVEAALDLIVTGVPVAAERALELGLVSTVTEPDRLVDVAIGASRRMARSGAPLRTRDADVTVPADVDGTSVFDARRARIGRRARGVRAPYACIECVEVAATRPFDEGIAFERETFMECRASLESKALRHAFFAEREARRVRGVERDTPTTTIDRAAVLGCGTMGGGIAMAFANAGIPVTVTDRDPDVLERGMETVRRNYDSTVSKGRLTRAEAEARLSRIAATVDTEPLADADIVVEAVFEDMALKKDLFTHLDQMCKESAILATNTSSLDVDEIAAATSRPERCVGTHFFSPANVMRLVEIVRGARTTPETLATAMELTHRLGKVGVVVGVCDSFAANRMLYPYTRQAVFLLEEGALPEQVDRVLYDFGMPMGPFALADLAGIDVGWRVRRHRESIRPKELRHSTLADRLYDLGRYGQKTRAGWYRYEEGSRTPIPDPAVTELIVESSTELGIERRSISDEEILQRCMYPLVNEGARILEEGIAERASDLDVVWLHGFGFPRHRGGPMFWADSLGLDHVLETMCAFHEEHRDWLEPAPLLERLAAEGRSFGEWRAG